MPQPQDLTPLFRDIFESPSLERMLKELDPYQFEDFVGFVFEQAGFAVEDAAGQFGQGLDLKLHASSPDRRKYGVSVKHFTPPGNVTGPQMMLLRGALHNGLVGVAVTIGDYNGPALDEALKEPRMWALNGEQFLRYMAYVRGSRPKTNPATSSAGKHPVIFTPAAISPDAVIRGQEVPFLPTQTRKVLTVANHKGGVGKTTTALNLAFGLAGHDKQILLVDMDAQANLTKALPDPQAGNTVPKHIGQYFTGEHTLAELVRSTELPGVWLIPSHADLTTNDMGLAAGPAAELQFVRDLHSLELKPPAALGNLPFDWIVIDTGPWMGLFTRSALAASHYVIMPIAPSVFADSGLGHLRRAVRTMSALTGRDTTILGCLVTQWTDDKLSVSTFAPVEAELNLAGITIFADRIPVDKGNIERSHIDTATGKKRTLLDRRCKSAKAYINVIEEVLTYVH